MQELFLFCLSVSMNLMFHYCCCAHSLRTVPGCSPHFVGPVHPETANNSQRVVWWFCKQAHIVPAVKQKKKNIVGWHGPEGKQIIQRSLIQGSSWYEMWFFLLGHVKRHIPWSELARASAFACLELSCRCWNLEGSSKNKHTHISTFRNFIIRWFDNTHVYCICEWILAYQYLTCFFRRFQV